MKQYLLAMFAIAMITKADAQLSSWSNISMNTRASDQSTLQMTVNVPNVLLLSPDVNSATVTLTQAQVQAGSGNYIPISSNVWTVWSNREYFVYYQANTNDNHHLNYTNVSNAYDDGDENSDIPLSDIKLRISNNNTGGTIVNGYHNYRGLDHANHISMATFYNPNEGNSIGYGTELINEGQPGQKSFTTDFEVESPGYNYVGGQYTATFIMWAIQE